MAELRDLSDLINRQTGGSSGSPETVFFFKTPRILGVAAPTLIAGRLASLWTYDGIPSSGATPTVGEIPNFSTVGAIPFTPPTGLQQKFLVSLGGSSLVAGTFLLYDRLFHVGGLNANITTDQIVQGLTPTPAITRNTSGVGNLVFYEIYSQIGTSQRTLTLFYTDQSGSRSESQIQIGGTNFREQTRAQLIPVNGIRSIEKVALNAGTTTAGNFGLTIAKPIAWIPCGTAGILGWRDFTTGLPGMPSLSGECLSLLFLPSSTTSPEVLGAFSCVNS